MKKILEKIAGRYKDWRISRMQRKLELGLELILMSIDRAALQLRVFCDLHTPYARMKTDEARGILNLGITSLKKCLPVCSKKFQIKALIKIQRVVASIE